MASPARACAVLLIALLAAWSVAWAAGSAAGMHDPGLASAHASHAPHHAGGPDDCPGCGEAGPAALCQVACASPALADLGPGAPPLAAPPADRPFAAGPPGLRGRSEPPDPFPPRPARPA